MDLVIPGRALSREPGIQAAVVTARPSGFRVRRCRRAPEWLRRCSRHPPRLYRKL